MTRNNLAHTLDIEPRADQSAARAVVPKDNGGVKVDREEVKRWRKLHGLSQELLAARSGLALKTIRNLEKNPDYHCRPITVDTLAKFFGIKPQMLLEQASSDAALRLLTSAQQVIEANMEIAASAKKVLACSGSRSRDEKYLRLVEETIQNNPDLIHYRAMSFPPFKRVFQDHLFRLLEVRNPKDRSLGYKTLHIGLYKDLVRQPEYSICANENMALVVLPSLSGIIGEYNTAMLFRGADAVTGFISMIKNLCLSGTPIETPETIRALGLVQEGDVYD